MPSRRTSVETSLPLRSESTAAGALRPSTAYIERVGLLALTHSERSLCVPFKSGAVGHTAAQVHMEGELAGGVQGRISLTLPAELGNILIIPRQALPDTYREIMPTGNSFSFGGEHLLRGIVQALSGRDVDGIRYQACVSFFDDPIKQVEEIVYATTGSQHLVGLYIATPLAPLH